MNDVLDADKAGSAVVWQLPKFGEAAGKRGPGAPTVRELDDIERSVHAEGFERGRIEGRVAGMAQAKDDIAQLRRLLNHFAKPLAEVSSELEQLVVSLSTAVAGALVRSRAAREPEIVAALVREALGTLPAGAREVEVQLHPDDLPLVQNLLANEPIVKLGANAMLARGDVRVNSDVVRLDATLNTRLANAAEALLAKP